MKLDALTGWFKSVFHHPPPALLRADLATEPWYDVPVRPVAAPSRPAPAPADDDADWDAEIARAKIRAAEQARSLPPTLPGSNGSRPRPAPPPSPARGASPQAPNPPTASPAPRALGPSIPRLPAPGGRGPLGVQAKLGAIARTSRNKTLPPPLPPSLAARA